MIRAMSVDGGASPSQQEPATRGFLFADLRGYTNYVERQGDDAGAALLDRYRQMVREVVARQSGSEVRTEGDSFYVLFPSASRAVQAALDIVAAAADETAARPDAPIRVGVGVHAGETAETTEGPVGSAVNIAARICAQAKAGEVLVSDTVRGLTRTRLVGTFEPVGTRRLKGIAEPMALYRVVPTGASTSARTAGTSRTRRWLYAVAAVLALLSLLIPIYLLLAGGTPAPAAGSPSPTATALAVATPTVGVSAPSALPTSTPSASSSALASPTVIPLPDTGTGINVPRPIPSGTYQAVAFRLGPTFTLSSGWSATTAVGDQFRLVPSDRPDSELVFLWLGGFPFPTDACGLDAGQPIAGSGELMTRLRALPGLTVGPTVLRKFTSVNVDQADVMVDDATACQYGTPHYVQIQPFGAGQGCCTGFQLNSGGAARVYVFGLDEEAIAAFAIAPTTGELEVFVPRVEDVLFTLKFSRAP